MVAAPAKLLPLRAPRGGSSSTLARCLDAVANAEGVRWDRASCAPTPTRPARAGPARRLGGRARGAPPRPGRGARRSRPARAARRARSARGGALGRPLLLPLARAHGRDRRRDERPRHLRARPRSRDREPARLRRARVDRGRRRAGEELLADESLAPYVHRLRRSRAEKPYVLTEPEEQALNLRRPVISAWQTLHGKQLATIEVEFDGGDGPEPHTIDRLLSYLYRPDRDVRRSALATLYDALEPRTDVLAACYDAVVGDRLVTDRARGYSGPMAATHLANELDDEIVNTMLDVVEEHYPVAQEWFRTKARLLGLDRLELSDQYAPLGEARRFAWPEAVEVVERGARPVRAGAGGGLHRLHRARPRRRGAAVGQGRRRLLRHDHEGHPAVRADELHGSVVGRDDAGARVRPRRALRARAPAAAVPGPPQRARARRGAVDVRAAARVRPPLRAGDGRGDADGARRRRGGGRAADGLPADGARTVRAAGVRAARRGEGADERAAVGGLARREPAATTATRSTCPTATASAGRTSRTSSTRASTRTPTRSRTS